MTMWDKVVEVNLVLLQTDSRLLELLGGPHFYRSRSQPKIITPSVQWTVVIATHEENYEPCVIQYDIFAHDADTAALIERRMYEIMHSDLPVDRGDLRMWSQYLDSWDFNNDNDESIYHRAVEYRYTPPRYNG